METWVFWGGWEGHEPKAAVDRFIPYLRHAGFEVAVYDSLTPLLDLTPDRRPALIVPCWTMGELPDGAETALIAAVRAGTGLAGWHGGMGDAFRSSTHYQFLVGGQFVAHPGNIIDYTVESIAPADAIMEGIESFAVHSEQYYLHYDPSIEILATTTFSGIEFPETNGVVMPVVWKRQFGAGRVFYSALGHSAAEFDLPETRMIMERGLLWAANRKGERA